MLQVDPYRVDATISSVYHEHTFTSIHDPPSVISHSSQLQMADQHREYDTGRLRSQYDSRSKRSPSNSSGGYIPTGSGFASAHGGRPTLPPLSATASNSPPRGLPSSSYGATGSYRAQSPGRYDDASSMSHYHSISNSQATAWPVERQAEPRGLPSQPAWQPYPQPHYDPRYPQQQQQTYYQPTQQVSGQDSQRRLPPLNISGLQGQEPSHSSSSSYLANASTARSTVGTYPPSHHYSVESRGSSRMPYSPQQYSSIASSHGASSSRHPSSSYTHAAGPSHTIPFASAEWSSSMTPAHTSRHEQAYQHQHAAAYGYAQTDRDSWGADLASPSSDQSPDEPLIKKKRKRADANQLRILNATYQRTAFPSTQERESLAKELDMSPRSVQIWFQNKRQSMRQSRNASNNLPPILHHAYSSSSPTEPKPTHQSYHTLSVEASSSRRRESTPSGDTRRRSG